ncbi:MAG TPA: adenylate/guanylate cyclase domain-containing protein [Gemmatimonadota bacterium]|nr:adenylate/guanylate cyclase domain-containing protein [Gemmatimonadota bacterium]
MSFCTECGSRLPEAAKFCPECGTKSAAAVAPPPPPPPEPTVTVPPLPAELREKFDSVRSELQGERREVVVLFADLKGYTSMSEGLDPEEVTILMNRLLRELAAAVYEYEGYVDKFIGDAVMALFGAPLAHEDDPQRGILAGLRMLQVVQAHNEKSEYDLALRVGLNLGEVVAAHMGSEMNLQYTVVGDTVNVASRLEGAAEPNTVLVSEAVWKRVRRSFDGTEVPPLTLKGKSEPIRGWRVAGVRKERRGREETPFVNRAVELARLTAALERAESHAVGAIVILAEAGVGKSRLVREALARAAGNTRVLRLHFSPVRLPGYRPPSVELFAQLAAGLEEARDLLGPDAEGHAHGLAALSAMAYPDAAGGEVLTGSGEPSAEVDPAAARQNRWLAIAALLRTVDSRQPVVLAVENVHWADEAAREFLAFLLSPDARVHVGALLTARSTDLTWLPDTVERMPIGPLEQDAAESMLGALVEDLPPEERRELIRRSAGNPLFIEELARALAETGGTGRAVPSMLQGLIMSRIDRLDPPFQHLLQMASVLGLQFPLPLLGSMYSLETESMGFEEALAGLEERGFLDRQGDNGGFLHALVQEVAYGGLLMRVRRVLHESAARLGEERFADRREAEAAFFAHHYWHADLPGEAAPHLWIAGRSAAAGWNLPAAEQFLRHAAEAFEKSDRALEPEDAARFEETLGNVLLHRGSLDEAESWFGRLEVRGRAAGFPEWEARGIEYQGRIAWYRGRLDVAQEQFERGLTIITDDSPRVFADLHNDLGAVFYYRHDFDRAFASHSTALKLRRELDDRLGIAKSLSNIGNILLHLKEDFDGAEEHYRKAHETAVEIGDRQMQYSALNNLGLVELARGDWEAGLATFERAMSILSEIGWSYARFVTLQNQAWCEMELGRLADALRHLQLCHEKGEAVLEPVNRARTRSFLFDVWLHIGALDRASDMLESFRAMVDELGLAEEEEEIRLREGRWLAEHGRWAEAVEKFARTEEEAARQKATAVELIARAHGCRARARAGLPDIGACDVGRAGANQPLAALVRYLLADAAVTREPRAEQDVELSAVLELADSLRMAPLVMACANRLGILRDALGDGEGARTAFARAAAAADALASGLPLDLREIFESRPDIADLRQRLAPA